jgi:general secretion pathway protein J
MYFRKKLPVPRHRQSGLTLIELLVSLVILGFVVTVMSGAFYQVAQVVRVAEGVNGQFQSQWLRLRALSDLVGNLVMMEGVERQFSGDAHGFEGFSLSLPQANWGVAQGFQVKLVGDDRGGMKLTLTPTDAKESTLVSWDRPMEFQYLAVDGSTELIWPPFGKNTDALPSAVVVRASSGERQVQLIARYAGVRIPERDGQKDLGKLFGLDAK